MPEPRSQVAFKRWLTRWFDRLDDLASARQVRRRDAEDTGQRMTLDDLIHEQGFEPDHFEGNLAANIAGERHAVSKVANDPYCEPAGPCEIDCVDGCVEKVALGIDALAEKATPGPWRVRRSSLDADHPAEPPAAWYIVAGSEKRRRNMGYFHPDDAVYSEDEHWVTAYASDRDYGTPEGGMSKEDAEFIVAVVNAYWEAHRG